MVTSLSGLPIFIYALPEAQAPDLPAVAVSNSYWLRTQGSGPVFDTILQQSSTCLLRAPYTLSFPPHLYPPFPPFSSSTSTHSFFPTIPTQHLCNTILQNLCNCMLGQSFRHVLIVSHRHRRRRTLLFVF